MLTYSSDKPSNPERGTLGSVADLLYDCLERLWYDVLPFLVAILITEWGFVTGVLIGDAIKGGWT